NSSTMLTSFLSFVCCVYYVVCFFVFFFQAEDGIRDGHVTGVQTCALPISADPAGPPEHACLLHPPGLGVAGVGSAQGQRVVADRSEERRVGKECRSRWSTYYEKKKREKR